MVRGNLLKGESKFIDSPTMLDYCRVEGVSIDEIKKFTKLPKSELVKIHKSNEHLFLIICMGCKCIKTISEADNK